MTQLIDGSGRAWPLTIDDECLDRIYRLTGVDVQSAEGMALAGQNEGLAFDVLYAAWRPLCEQRGVKRPDWHRLEKRFLWLAAQCFIRELSKYFSRIGEQKSADVLSRVANGQYKAPASIQLELKERYADRANELAALNTERAIDEKLAELHSVVGKSTSGANS